MAAGCRRQPSIETLLAIVSDVSLSARRGQATEGIGNQLQFSERAALVRRATLQLIAHLRDPVSDVRFWSAFSLITVVKKEFKALLIFPFSLAWERDQPTSMADTR